MEGVAVGSGKSIGSELLEKIESGEKEFSGIEEVDLVLAENYTLETLNESDIVRVKNAVRFHCNHKNAEKNVVDLPRLSSDPVIKSGRCEECNTIYYVLY